MSDLSEVPCAGEKGPCPFTGDCNCGSRCHCPCYVACDEVCEHEACARWRAWFDSLPDEVAREIIRVYWVEPMKATLAEALIEVAGGAASSPQAGEDGHPRNLQGQAGHATMWQIHDPLGDVSSVHETEAEFIRELADSLRRSPANTELRVSKLVS
jgi:hypothetical protein